jgi:hypothetical protein
MGLLAQIPVLQKKKKMKKKFRTVASGNPKLKMRKKKKKKKIAGCFRQLKNPRGKKKLNLKY